MSVLDSIANPMIADIGGNFTQGVERGRQNLSRDLVGNILASTFGGKLGNLGSVNPEAAMSLAKGLGIPANEKERLQSYVGDIQAATAIANGSSIQDAKSYLMEVADRRSQLGIDSPKLKAMIDFMDTDPEGAKDGLNSMTAALVEQGFLKSDDGGATAEEQSFNALTANLSPEDQEKARRIKLRLDPGAMGSAAQTIAGSGNADTVAGVEAKLAGGRTAGAEGVKIASKMFEKIQPIRAQLVNYDDAIAALDAGASTGPIMSKLPSFRASAVALDNAQKQLGLNVIQNTTFGALSEGEMALALDTALPTNLAPPELRQWLVEHKGAQEKLLSYVESAASYLSIPGSTIGQFIKDQKEVTASQASNPQQNSKGYTLMEDANGNRAFVGPNGEVEPI